VEVEPSGVAVGCICGDGAAGKALEYEAKPTVIVGDVVNESDAGGISTACETV
jgi:hypothetical protein